MSYSPLKFKDMKELEDYYYQMILQSDLKKADVPLLSNTTGWLNAIYGKKVWAQLNMEANIFALLPKEPWANSGIRFKTQRATTDGSTEQSNGLGGVDAEALSALPYTLRPTYLQVKVAPKTIWHGFNAAELSDFLATVDDAIDIVPQLRQDIGEFHAFQMNHMLLVEANTPAAHNLESVDRICTNTTTETTGYVSAATTDFDIWNAHGGSAGTAAGLTRDGANSDNAWADAQENAGGNNTAGACRTLTLSLIDDVQQKIWNKGGVTKVIITGYDTLMRWQQLLEAERRYMDSATVVPTYGGVKGVAPGVEGGFMVATYNSVPIIVTQAMVTAKNANETLSRIEFLDTDFLRLRVAKPTRYLECRDIFALDSLQLEGAYETIGEIICTFFAGQGKLRDLK